jgi:dGTPase
LKYVRSTDTAAARAEHFTKKPGFFQTEAAHVQQVWEEFGYTSPQRFPLAYIMEAADDLAYCISDLEDSIEKGLLSKDTALSEILDQWKETAAGKSDSTTLKISEILKNAAEGKNHRGDPFTYTDFRTSLNRAIAEFSADRYVSNHDAILQGTFPPLLAGDTAPGTILELLKGYCRKHVYSAESVQRVELAGYSAILGLLSHCQCLLEASFDRFSKSLDFGNTKDSSGAAIVIEKKLLKLFPKNYLLVYRHEVGKLNQAGEDFPFDEWQLRAHLVTDFLSGMTDDFAMTTFRNLSGMRL